MCHHLAVWIGVSARLSVCRFLSLSLSLSLSVSFIKLDPSDYFPCSAGGALSFDGAVSDSTATPDTLAVTAFPRFLALSSGIAPYLQPLSFQFFFSILVAFQSE